MDRLVGSLSLVLGLLVCAATARADDQGPQAAGRNEGAHARLPSPTAAAPREEGPDIVRLRNGKVFRGMIIERIAGLRVVLLLNNGMRRTFPARDVVYAGQR